MLVTDLIEVDDTGMLQCTIERDDGSFVVTTFPDRESLIQFVAEDTIYGTDPRLTSGRGNYTWM